MKLFFSLLLIACTATAQAKTPSDVSKILARNELCVHFSGEINGDGSDEDKAVMKAMDMHCKGLSADKARLIKKYKNNKSLLLKLEPITDDFQ